jgi:phage terminase Nu1 subunit (DNA packaging protein)
MSMRYLSITQISEMCGLDRRTIKKRLASIKVHMKEGKAHLYDMFEANSMLYGTSTLDDTNVIAQMSREELRLQIAKADEKEMHVGQLRAELVSIEDVASTVEREYGAVRAGLLSIPSKVSQDLVIMDDFIKIKNLLEDAVNEVLTELSADKSYAETLPNVTTPSTATPSESAEDTEAQAQA